MSKTSNLSNRGFAAKRLATDGILIAIFFALTFFSVTIGGVKITFDSLPVVLCAMLFGPIDAFLVGFLGANSATMRQAAMQTYIPEELRARLNAFQNMLVTAASGLFALIIGALGEVLDYRLCVTICGATAFIAAWLLVWRRRADVRKIFEK